MNYPTSRLEAIEFLRTHPEYHRYGGKKLAELVTEPKCCYTTWKKARKALSLPPVDGYANRTRKQQRKAAFALYPNTHKIVIDTKSLKVVFHGEGGFKVAEKPNKKALSASLRLFRLAKFETRDHDTESGIMVLTLEAQR